MKSACFDELWRRAASDAEHMQRTQTDAWAHAEPAQQSRRWLLGYRCANHLRVRHLAHHFMFRCVLRIRAELQGKSPQEVDVRNLPVFAAPARAPCAARAGAACLR